MAHIEGTNRSQTLLLPESVDDYVGTDNPVRFLDAFVDELDLKKAGFARTTAKATGRPGYHPGDLLKLYIYGYLNRVRSSRRLEAETHRNLEVIWLLKRLRPDFKTIADFRRDNRAAFREVFRAFVVLCRGLDLFGRELLAVDGTRLKAVNNEDRNFTQAKLKRDLAKSDERLARYLEQLDEADQVDDDGPRSRNVDQLREKIKAIRERRDRLLGYRAQIESNGEGQLSLTDPDARGMPATSGVNVGYNIQIAVDVKHKLIVEQQVHNKVSDIGLLTDTAVAARKNLDVDQISAVADKGYYKIEDIRASAAAGIVPYVPKPKRGPAVGNGFFAKEDFRYDAEGDFYICPGDQRLPPTSKRRKTRNIELIDYTNPAACKRCALRARCTNSKFRQISRYKGEELLDEMAARLEARPDVLNLRRESVEHPFGSIKQWMGQKNFLMRRLDNVRAEFSLTALAYNIRRVITLLGIPAMIAAVRA
jgi:transposase